MSLAREPVSATPRGAMTPARRHRIWLAAGGKCFMCSKPVPEAWTVLDHEIQLWMSGPDDDAYIRPLCGPCDKLKTAADATKRAKVKRILKREAGEKNPTTLQGRGFKPPYPKLKSRNTFKRAPSSAKPAAASIPGRTIKKDTTSNV